jgi:dipeptidyl aminopeptidase/acylaminoacyl peptidase
VQPHHLLHRLRHRLQLNGSLGDRPIQPRTHWWYETAMRNALLVTLMVVLGCGGGAPRAAAPTTPYPLPETLIEGEGTEVAAPKPPPAAVTQGPVVLQGTPPIPAELKQRLARYANTRRAILGAIADDGGSIVITTRFGQTAQAHLVSQPLGARRQLTFRDEPVNDLSFVPGSATSLTYRSDIGGNETYQLFHADLKAGRSVRWTDGKSRHGGYRWSHDGQRIAFTNNARNGKDMDVYLGDGLHPAKTKLLLERQGHWVPLDWSQDGQQLLLAQYISINDSRLYVVDVAAAKVTPITPESPRASYRAARFAHSGKTVYLATDREGEHVELYEVDIASGKSQPLSRHLKWNVTELALSPDGRTLAFTVNEGGWGTLRLLDTRTRRELPKPAVPKGIVIGLRFARQAPVLGFTLLGPTETGDAYSWDLRRKRLTRWTESEIGGLDPRRFVTPELIEFPTFDGRKIPAFYYRPRTQGPHPVVVRIHGGPEGQARPYFRALIQYLVVESQVAVLVPNVRGSDGYGKSYLLLDNGFKREDSVKDIGALLDEIARRPELDEKRVAVMGGSYGGYMVLASLVHFGPRIVAGIDYVGISNFVTFLKNTKAYRRDLRRAEYGDERDPKMHAHLQRISPSTNASKIVSALFVAHGANDPRVPLSETEQVAAAVRSQGRDVWTLVANNEGHGFRKKANRDLFTELTVLFLERHLRP